MKEFHILERMIRDVKLQLDEVPQLTGEEYDAFYKTIDEMENALTTIKMREERKDMNGEIIFNQAYHI